MPGSLEARFTGVIGVCLALAACSDSNNDRDGNNSASEAPVSFLCAAEDSPVNPARLFLQQLLRPA